MGDTDEVKVETQPATPETQPATPEAPPPPTDDVKAFRSRLRGVPWVTYAIIAANVIVYLVGLALGADWMKPDVPTLVKLGGDYAPLTLHGQWWRLVTATFLHIGAFHLFLNMAVLAQVGLLVELFLGSTSFLAIYLLCGIFGSLASVGLNPYVVSAGASGAVFGLYGVFVGFLLRERGSIPAETSRKLLTGAAVFIGLNVVNGLRPGIDMAGHIGGLVSGFLIGLAVAAPLTPEAMAGRRRRGLLVAAVAAVAAVAIAVALPKPADIDAEIQAASKVEEEVNGIIQRTEPDFLAKKIDGKGYAAVLREQIIPKWEAARKRLAAVPMPNGRPGKVLAAMMSYMNGRAAAFDLFAEALDTEDQEKAAQAVRMTREAADQLRESLK